MEALPGALEILDDYVADAGFEPKGAFGKKRLADALQTALAVVRSDPSPPFAVPVPLVLKVLCKSISVSDSALPTIACELIAIAVTAPPDEMLGKHSKDLVMRREQIASCADVVSFLIGLLSTERIANRTHAARAIAGLLSELFRREKRRAALIATADTAAALVARLSRYSHSDVRQMANCDKHAVRALAKTCERGSREAFAAGALAPLVLIARAGFDAAAEREVTDLIGTAAALLLSRAQGTHLGDPLTWCASGGSSRNNPLWANWCLVATEPTLWLAVRAHAIYALWAIDAFCPDARVALAAMDAVELVDDNPFLKSARCKYWPDCLPIKDGPGWRVHTMCFMP